MKKQSLNDREMEIFRVRLDARTKVGSIKFNEKNLKSEAELITALNQRQSRL